MNFGSLQIVTAWRLKKDGVMSQGIIMNAPEGTRLVVIENQQVVEWTRFGRIFDLRRHVNTTLKVRKQAGWVPWVAGTAAAQVGTDLGMPSPSRRPADAAHGLLTIAEQA